MLEPVEVEIVQTCAFREKPCKACGLPHSNKVHTPKRTATCAFRGQRGCASCGLPKKDRSHFGKPPSLNVLGSGDPRTYMALKEQWQALLTDVLESSGLPKGLKRVTVEGEATFPTRPSAKGPDQGNFRSLIEKALGDALEQGGWLPNDNWLHYEFGGLAYRHEPGVSRTRLVLFPFESLPQDENAPALFPHSAAA